MKYTLYPTYTHICYSYQQCIQTNQRPNNNYFNCFVHYYRDLHNEILRHPKLFPHLMNPNYQVRSGGAPFQYTPKSTSSCLRWSSNPKVPVSVHQQQVQQNCGIVHAGVKVKVSDDFRACQSINRLAPHGLLKI